jgi:type IV pilus assembly protein PilY1
MAKMKKWILLLPAIVVMFIPPLNLQADDSDLFTTRVPPDVLILLDMSGSMNYSSAGPPYAPPPQRRIDMARQVIFDLLDDNNDFQIDGQDGKILDMRLGYMRFRDSSDNDDSEPLTGAVRVLVKLGASYQDIWNKVSSPDEADPMGGTPLAASLMEAGTYFRRDVNPKDVALSCRRKFVVLITDGTDTIACGGNGTDPGTGDESVNPGMFRRRMLTVQKAQELFDAGIRVFVVGFGEAMPERLRTTLNWTAKYGGTDNPLELNSGNPLAYRVVDYGNACGATDLNADPSVYPLSGYAFFAKDAAQLSLALKSIARAIKDQAYTFTAITVPSVKLADGSLAFVSSFVPNEGPLWRGTLKAYALNEGGGFGDENQDGSPDESSLKWDAAVLLNERDPGSRRILTYANGIIKGFVPANLTREELDVTSDGERDRLVQYVRGFDAYDADGDEDRTEKRLVAEQGRWVPWILGDIFHSNSVVVGSPSRFYQDAGFDGPGKFFEMNKNRPKVVLVGANDGMLHAFDAETGREEWAFIPPSVLRNLKSMVSVHTYFLDSTPKVSDVWVDRNGDRIKTADEWKTVLVSGLRKGGKQYVALDITDTLNPAFMWEFPKPPDPGRLERAGESWPEPAIGRVKIESQGELVEKWVVFVAGGKDSTHAAGKLFLVLDIETGNVLKEFSGLEEMTFSIAASPLAVDMDSDGYIDRVYVGDLGGQMWVFDVSFDRITKKSESRWSGRMLFKAPGVPAVRHPIYHQAAVAFDRLRTPWIFFGTGDRENPGDIGNPREGFYGVKDDGDGNYPREADRDLSDVTSLNTFDQDTLKKGWFIRLEKTEQRSEKVLAKPTVFNGLVHFTTYTHVESADLCSVTGVAKLYTVEYLSGGGALEFSDRLYAEGNVSERSKEIGAGIASAPVISVTSSGSATVSIGTTGGRLLAGDVHSPSSRKTLLYWREVIP